MSRPGWSHRFFACLAIAIGLLAAAPLAWGGVGDLDPSFGAGGVTIGNVFGPLNAVVVQPTDGKIISVGYCTGVGDDFCLTRQNPDGSLDPSFGNGGEVKTDISTDFDDAYAAALQPDGKIVVGGGCDFPPYFASDFCIARYTPSGQLDLNFGGGKGWVSTDFALGADPFENFDRVIGVAIQTDGKIVAAGTCADENVGIWRFCLARYGPDGGLNAKVVTPVSGGTDDEAAAIVMQPDGSIVVVGTCRTPAVHFCLVRYSPNTNLDLSFGSGGVVVSTGFLATADGVALQADGGILVSGACFDPPSGACVARYDAFGQPDPSFGTGGKVVTGASGDVAAAVAVQSDGKIVTAGTCFSAPAGTGEFCVARFNPDGTLDGTFGNGGRVLSGFTGTGDAARTLAIQGDGKLVAAGDCGGSFCVARYLVSGPVADPQSVATDEDTSLAITLTGSDPSGNPLTFAIATPPANGTLTGTPPDVTYAPNPNYNGPDGFTFTVSNGAEVSGAATVSITVNPVNDPPVAQNAAIATDENTPVVFPVSASDIDSPSLTFTITGGPSHGTVSAISGSSCAIVPNGTGTPGATCTMTVAYQPLPGYNGPDSFTFTANDGSADSNTATVSITVNPVNDPPLAQNFATATDEDTPIAFALTATDPDSTSLTFALSGGPAHGTVSPTGGPMNCTIVPNGTGTPGATCTVAVAYQPLPDYNGPDGFSFTVTDDGGLTSTAVVSITVNPVDDPPVAYDTAVGTTQGTPLVITLHASDIDSTSLKLHVISPPLFGQLNTMNGPMNCTIQPNDTKTPGADCVAIVKYLPMPAYSGPDSFTFVADDGLLISAPAKVSITITPVDQPPVAQNVAVATNEDTPVAITLNASDPDSKSLSFTVTSAPAHGTVSPIGGPMACTNPPGIICNVTVTYQPLAGYTGPDSFTFVVTDDAGLSSAPATAFITVAPVDQPPVAVDDTYLTNENTALTVFAPGVLGNDTDVDTPLAGLTAVLVTGPGNAASFALNPDGSFTYTPVPNFSGIDSFTYKANDGQLDSNVATVTITVNAVDQAPVAVNDFYATNENVPLGVAAPGVLGNDNDVDTPLSGLSAILVSGPSHAAAFQLNADGSFTYTPAPSYSGPDSFTYKVNDGQLDSNVATVTITVQAVDVAPVANNDSYTTAEDTTLTVDAATGVLANDTDVDTPHSDLTAELVQGPADAAPGGFNLNPDGSFTYTPAAGFSGNDTFSYRVFDGHLFSGVAMATITVTHVNHPPVAVNDGYATNKNQTLNVPPPGVLGNDSDPDGDTFGARLVAGPSQAASFTLNDDGSFSYTPKTGFAGTDTFTYQAQDPSGALSNVATVTIKVIDQPPVAVNDSYVTNKNQTLTVAAPGVLGDDSDPDGDAVTSVLAAGPAQASSFALKADGSFSYTPKVGFAGIDSFTYQAQDTSGALSNVATVSITVVNGPPVTNSPPKAIDDHAVTTSSTPVTIAVLANDFDPDGDPLTVVAVTQGASGAVVINADGSVTYTPKAGFTGNDSFTYTISDGRGGTAVGTVRVRVNK